MNTLNHHRIIESLDLDFNTSKIFEDASDFTDDFCKDAGEIELKSIFVDLEELRHLKVKLNEDNYFYYHFYYDIEYEEKQCNEGKITLSRSKRDENKTDATIGKCTLGDKESRFKKTHIVVDNSPNPKNIEPGDIPLTTEDSFDGKKEFFTLINGRDKYLKSGFSESSNQSDCVAFLHAMAATEEESEQEKLVFNDPGADPSIMRAKEIERNAYQELLKQIHDELSWAGCIPVIGVPFDLANAVIYGLQGKIVDASWSLASAIPGIGDAAGIITRATKTITKKIQISSETTSKMLKWLSEFAKSAESNKWYEVAKNLLDKAFEETYKSLNDNNSESNNSNARTTFEEHLKKCFAEYLFLKEEDEALFILGIAFHAIMDSFTPSHTSFQKYNYQDSLLHTQGDVIPIRKKDIKDSQTPIDLFDPGEAEAEEWVTGGKAVVLSFIKGAREVARNPAEGGKTVIMSLIKGDHKNYISKDSLNKMLWIYFLISDIAPVNNEVSPSKSRELSIDDITHLWKQFENYSLDKTNDILKQGYNYGNRAWVYADNAIKSLSEIFSFLQNEKKNNLSNYSAYCNNKNKIINDALELWRKQYDEMYANGDFKNRQNLLRLIFKKEEKNSLTNKFMVWSGDTLDSIANKGKKILDEMANNIVKSASLFPSGGANKA